jgi:site-specific DNA-methyltransferase (adenine-specific)
MIINFLLVVILKVEYHIFYQIKIIMEKYYSIINILNLINLLNESVFTIIEKIKYTKNISNMYNSKDFFRIKTNDKNFIDDNSQDNLKCFVSKQKGYIKYYPKNKLKSLNKIDKIKIALPSASGKGGMNENFYNRIELLNSNEICSESFIFFNFDNIKIANNFKEYLKTDFVSFLVRLRKIKQHITSDIFKFVPELDFSNSWTDEELYKYFNFTSNEINLIENIIK